MNPASFRSLVSAMFLAGASIPIGQAGEAPPPPVFDDALAAQLGADERGMRSFVLAVLVTGPQDALITGPGERAGLFRGHFENMARLEAEGKLLLAGPLGGEEGRRGLFILNTSDPDEAAGWVASDPAVAAGLFTVDYSRYYGPAGLLMVNDIQRKIRRQAPLP